MTKMGYGVTIYTHMLRVKRKKKIQWNFDKKDIHNTVIIYNN